MLNNTLEIRKQFTISVDQFFSTLYKLPLYLVYIKTFGKPRNPSKQLVVFYRKLISLTIIVLLQGCKEKKKIHVCLTAIVV